LQGADPRRQRVGVFEDRALQLGREGELFFVGQVERHLVDIGARCRRCGKKSADFNVSPPRLDVPLASARLALRLVLGPCIVDRLPLEIGNGVGSAASERYNVIFPKTRTRAACSSGRWARLRIPALPHGDRCSLAEAAPGRTEETYAAQMVAHRKNVTPSAFRSSTAPGGRDGRLGFRSVPQGAVSPFGRARTDTNSLSRVACWQPLDNAPRRLRSASYAPKCFGP
jgi:hypothetical protein